MSQNHVYSELLSALLRTLPYVMLWCECFPVMHRNVMVCYVCCILSYVYRMLCIMLCALLCYVGYAMPCCAMCMSSYILLCMLSKIFYTL